MTEGMHRNIFREARRMDPVEPSPIRDLMDEVAAMKGKYDDVVSFCAGEPDFSTPEPIKRETIRALRENDTHYASSLGVLSLRREISRKIKEESGCSYDPETEIMVTCGAAEAINNVLLSFLNPGDEVLVFTPAFITYKNLVLMTGAKFVEVPLNREAGYQINMDLVKKLTTERTRAVILNNPCNPTGAVFEEEGLGALCRWIREKNLMVIADEIYADIVYDGKKTCSVASFPDMKERLLLISGFSKTYAMTGWRIGYVAADRRFMETLLKFHTYCSTCEPTFLQSGIARGLRDPETLQAVDRMVETFAKRRELVLKGLDKIDHIRYVKPYGAFYILLDVSETGMDGYQFSRELLQKKHVAVVPADAMGKGCREIVRLSYACSGEMIREGLRRMREFVTEK